MSSAPNWKPGEDYAIRFTDKDGDPRTGEALQAMVDAINAVAVEHGFSWLTHAGWTSMRKVAVGEQNIIDRFAERDAQEKPVLDQDWALLIEADVGWVEDGVLSLNMNDTWTWGCSDLERVPGDQIEEVARLFRTYGNAGLLYWVSRRRNNCRSAFLDNNRFIDFVAHEEGLRQREPQGSKRAYMHYAYALGTIRKDEPARLQPPLEDVVPEAVEAQDPGTQDVAGALPRSVERLFADCQRRLDLCRELWTVARHKSPAALADLGVPLFVSSAFHRGKVDHVTVEQLEAALTLLRGLAAEGKL